MTKSEFLNELKHLISELDSKDINKYIEYYSEIIDDRIEDGALEEDAVSALGSPILIANQILKDNGIESPFKDSYKGNNFKLDKKDPLVVLLIIASFPIWFSLLAVAFSVVVAVYSVVLAVWAISFGFIIGGVAGVIGGVIGIFIYDVGVGISLIGGGLALIGLSILSYYGAKYLTKTISLLYKKSVEFIKSKFKKEA